MDRYAIIGGEIHKLVRIHREEEWSQYAWRIPHDAVSNLYWIPVPNENKDGHIDEVCFPAKMNNCDDGLVARFPIHGI